jgi:hypothetical protein
MVHAAHVAFAQHLKRTGDCTNAAGHQPRNLFGCSLPGFVSRLIVPFVHPFRMGIRPSVLDSSRKPRLSIEIISGPPGL